MAKSGFDATRAHRAQSAARKTPVRHRKRAGCVNACAAARDHRGLGVLAGHDQRVLLGGAADHFIAGFQGHPRSGLWRAGLAPLGVLGHRMKQPVGKGRPGLGVGPPCTALEHFPTEGNRWQETRDVESSFPRIFLICTFGG
jgi:hypothetical protein